MKLLCSLGLIAVLCLGPAFAGAQEKSTAPPSAQPADDDLPRVETKFDSAKNETTVGFRLLQILGTESQKLLISAEATYATNTPKRHPEHVMFIISALNKKGYQYQDGMLMNITVNGKGLGPILLARLDKRTAGGDYYETMVSLIKYDVFMKLATANNATIQFEQTYFDLQPKHLTKLRELADLLHLPTSEKAT